MISRQRGHYEENNTNIVFNTVASICSSQFSERAELNFLMNQMLPISVCNENADIRENITTNISSVAII